MGYLTNCMGRVKLLPLEQSPLGAISFNFMQFSAKILPNNRFSPKMQGLPPVWEILDLSLKWNALFVSLRTPGSVSAEIYFKRSDYTKLHCE